MEHDIFQHGISFGGFMIFRMDVIEIEFAKPTYRTLNPPSQLFMSLHAADITLFAKLSHSNPYTILPGAIDVCEAGLPAVGIPTLT